MTPVDYCEAWSTGVVPVRTEGSVTPVDLSERSFVLLNFPREIIEVYSNIFKVNNKRLGAFTIDFEYV